MKSTMTIKNHFGVGAHTTHPIFSTRYIPENLASLVETLILFAELVLIFLFGFSTICLYAHFDNAGIAIINGYADGIFKLFRSDNTAQSNFIALGIILLVAYINKRYFDWVKYNLHPKDEIYSDD